MFGKSRVVGCTSTLLLESFFFSFSLASFLVAGVALPCVATNLLYSLSAFPFTMATGLTRYKTAFSADLNFAICLSSCTFAILSNVGLLALDVLAEYALSSERLVLMVFTYYIT